MSVVDLKHLNQYPEHCVYLIEQLPYLLVLVDLEYVVAREHGGAGHAEDVVHIQHHVGDVTQRLETEHHLLPWCWRSETITR